MPYTVHQLSQIAGVSPRTLHYYDQIHLLRPSQLGENGYRYYEEAELLRLQQILFFKELDFPLEEINRILSLPNFDIEQALRDQRKLLILKQKRLDGLINTIDKTIKKINKKISMKDEELYGSFTKEEMNQYAQEAKQKWGHTDAYKQSAERVKKMSKEDLKKISERGEQLMKKIVTAMPLGAEHEEVQKLISEHYDNLRTFYEPTLEIYRGLAQMYIADPRFSAYFTKFHPDLPQFIHDAMLIFCEK